MNELQTNQEPKEIDLIKEYLKDYLTNFTNYYNPSKKYANKILCRNPEHNEIRPSMSFNKNNNTLHCFSCGATYTIIDLVIMDYDLGDLNQPLEARLKDKGAIKEAIAKIKELFNIEGNAPSPKNYTKSQPKEQENFIAIYNQAVLGYPTLKYLKERGISEPIIKAFGIKNNSQDGLIIPYQLKGDLWTYTSRIIPSEIISTQPPKELRYKHHGVLSVYDPLNYLGANQERVIFITEGEIDTLSIYEAISSIPKEQRGVNCGSVALGGVNNTRDLLKKLASIQDKTKVNLIFYQDNDERGEKGAKDLELALRDMAFNVMIAQPKKSFKDANEYLKNDREAFIEDIKNYIANIKKLIEEQNRAYNEAINKEIENERKEYISNNSILGYLNQFKDHREHPLRPVRTYFNELDNVLKGGFREGLITIGAVSSLGKTSFILQLADQIAQTRQKDIFYFSLEMSKDELIAKSLSRLMYLNCKNYTERVKSQAEIMNPISWKKEELDLFNYSLEDYKSFAKNLYISEGVGSFGVKQIEEQIKNHIARTNRTPLIIIDYLQILASPDNRLNDKQKTDANIVELKRMSRDLHTPIILVSALNRASYSIDVSLESFKESGVIEYTSDLIIGLNYNLTTEQLEQLKNLKDKNKQLPDSEKDNAINDFYKKIRASSPRTIKLDVLKNRAGQNNASISFLFYPEKNFFIETKQNLTTFKEILGHSRDHKEDNEEYIELPF